VAEAILQCKVTSFGAWATFVSRAEAQKRGNWPAAAQKQAIGTAVPPAIG
jgi:hypothetical protein